VFWVQGSGSSAFVAKNSNITSFSELVREWLKFGIFCTDFCGAPQNVIFGLNGVERVLSLRKIPA
jgi:hypothetical protein